eukprot:CAMPEP_0194488086 /NCGR_PEP_ID=MMETSP0253-20130528/8145_1 /TAXON_ID=2966 /ORGANISM="Noctiluca scintillans" /LENGTH=143 /DNA_ID=CAMNT_0039328407 /DNA_START=61 /DNA_END=489 /DNA_ORIENTATION=+
MEPILTAWKVFSTSTPTWQGRPRSFATEFVGLSRVERQGLKLTVCQNGTRFNAPCSQGTEESNCAMGSQAELPTLRTPPRCCRAVSTSAWRASRRVEASGWASRHLASVRCVTSWRDTCRVPVRVVHVGMTWAPAFEPQDLSR